MKIELKPEKSLPKKKGALTNLCPNFLGYLENSSMDFRMKQEKRSLTGRFYETHIFAKFIDFGQKNINSDLPYIVVLQQNSDSPQRKIGYLNFSDQS